MSNQLTTKPSTFLSPKSAQEAFQIAENLANSSMIPKSFIGKPNDIVVCMAYGAELGLQPLQSLQNIAVINGNPSLWGDAMRALVLNSHDLVTLEEWNEGDVFYCRIVRKSRLGGEISITKSFGDAEAQKANLLGKQGPWKQYPDRMKQMRAFGFAARDAYADRLRGFITREEAEDITQVERDITPQPKPDSITGNAAIDALTGEVEPERVDSIGDEEFNSLLLAINSTESIEQFGLVMSEMQGVKASEEQLGKLREAAKAHKKTLTQVDFNN